MVGVGLAAATRADVIIDWNNVYIDTIRAVGGPPCPIARAGAMLHAAMYDAVNSVEKTNEPYLRFYAAPAGTSEIAAAATAARDVMVSMYPQRAATYEAALTKSLAQVPSGKAKSDGIALGHTVATTLMAVRAHDGTQTEPVYVYGKHPGDYCPTPPDYGSPPFNPGWGVSMPWTMIKGSQFRTGGPLGHKSMASLLSSRGYADQVNEVKSLGAHNSTTRTPYQTQTAYFWANDVNGTYKPPGQLNAITQVVSADRHLTMPQNARLFALVNLALADAGLVAWDCKYDTSIDLWRPVSAIRNADWDHNHWTTVDPNWLPLNAFTPTFPSYVSGHATFSAAHAAIMTGFFGTDHVTFTVGTDEPLYTGGPRTYTSFSQAAIENGRSRVYLGVHYSFDSNDGYKAGTALGQFVYAHHLRPLPPPPHQGNGNGNENGNGP
jgi:membrane-associated phospholipid phosphatase